MTEVLRNESNQIVDHEGNPLDLAASYNMAEVHRTGEKSDQAQALADAELAKDPAAQEAYGTDRAAKDATLEHKAAKWDAYQHFHQNQSAYYEAAQEEDQRRAESRPDGQQPAS
jgi:hypothetical protein